MNLRHILLLISIWILGPFAINAQPATSPKELPDACFAQLDREIYIVGEQLWYSVFFLQPAEDVSSTVVHVDLVDPKGNVVAYNKHPIDENHSYGDFYLDPSWTTGVYTFRVYTLWNAQFSPGYSFVRDLPVFGKDVNLEKSGEKMSGNPLNSRPTLKTLQQSMGLEISLSNNNLSPRDSLKISLLLGPEEDPVDARVSISVMRMDERLPSKKLEGILDRSATLASLSPVKNPSVKALPPQNSLRFWGEVSPQGETTPPSLSVFLTDSSQFRSSQIEGSNFRLSVPSFYGSQVAQVFMEGVSEAALSWGEVQDIFPVGPNPSTVPDLSIIQTAFLRHKKRKQFQQLFDLPSLAQAPTIISTKNTLIPDQRFLTEDYIAFKNLEDFIRETIYIRLKGKRPPYTLRLLNKDRNLYFKETPLFLVNGYITSNQDAVLEIPWRDVERVELFLSSYRLLSQFADLGNFGVMAIYTKSQKTPREILAENLSVPLQGFQIPSVFQLPNSSLQEGNGESFVPDLRPVEYWNPKVALDSRGSARIVYPLSDAKGDFLIRVTGLSKKGIPFYREQTFTVD
ncbi:MAG: hypothetical protein AAGA10_05890 [Bacteroidota bacterium]